MVGKWVEERRGEDKKKIGEAFSVSFTILPNATENPENTQKDKWEQWHKHKHTNKNTSISTHTLCNQPPLPLCIF